MSSCGYCKTIKEELTKNNIEFEEKLNTEFEEEWTKVAALTKMATTPTVYYKNNYFVPGRDFQSAKQLADRLKSFETPKYTQSRRTFERVKTLNFHMNTAFSRLDQLLRKIETKINTDEHKSTN